ncbi:MAG: hypothetical protein ACR2LS_06695 [Thermomicrobiales bacterium]
MEPRPPRSQTNPPPADATPTGGSEAAPAPEQAAPDDTSVFRPDYGPVARVPPTGDPINLRPAPPSEMPPPAPRRQSRALWFAVLAGIGIIVLLLVATIATVAWIGSGDDGDDPQVVGAAPTQTREAEVALIADLQTQVAAAATPGEAPTQESLLPAPTELVPTPTAPAAAAATAPVATATAASDAPVVAAAGLADGTTVGDLLPVAADVPEALVLTDEASLTTIEEVVGGFSDPEDAAVQLETWEWVENASRTFGLSDGAAAPESGLTFLYVSVHQFGSAEAAQEALTYFADDLTAVSGLVPAETEEVGETSRGLVEPNEDGTEVGALYVQQGSFLLRIGTFAAQDQSLGIAVEEAQTILTRAEQA